MLLTRADLTASKDFLCCTSNLEREGRVAGLKPSSSVPLNAWAVCPQVDLPCLGLLPQEGLHSNWQAFFRPAGLLPFRHRL